MIKGLSDRRRLPRAGIIRLGIKKKSQGGKEHPFETDYFVVPEVVKDTYGNEPKEMLIMFPVEDEQTFFQQFYKCWGNGVLLCRGDGEEATYWDFDKGGFFSKPCPCEKLERGACAPEGILQFLLPEVKEAVGVWQITTGSKNSIIDINSGIDFVRGIAGRVAMIPLVLRRELTETHRIEGKDIKKGKHYTLKLSLGMSLMEIQKLGLIHPTRALLPPPDETPNGVAYKSEEEAPAALPEAPGEQLSPQEQAGQDLADDATSAEDDKQGRQDMYRTITLTMSNGTLRKVSKFDAYKYFGKLREQLGETDYYAVLGEHGYEHCNQIPDKKLPEIYEKLLGQYVLQQEEAEAEAQDPEPQQAKQGELC